MVELFMRSLGKMDRMDNEALNGVGDRNDFGYIYSIKKLTKTY